MQQFTSADVFAILGIPHRTLDYWDEQDVVRPSLQQAEGKGTIRLYSYDNLIELRVVMRLRDIGLSLQRIRKGLNFLRRSTRRPARDIVLVTDGKDLFEKRKGNQLVSVLNNGQMAFGVVVLGRIPLELDESIRNLKAARERRSSIKIKRARRA